MPPYGAYGVVLLLAARDYTGWAVRVPWLAAVFFVGADRPRGSHASTSPRCRVRRGPVLLPPDRARPLRGGRRGRFERPLARLRLALRFPWNSHREPCDRTAISSRGLGRRAQRASPPSRRGLDGKPRVEASRQGPVMRTMPTGPDAQGTWNGLADRRPGFRQAGGRAVARGAGMVIADTQKSDESARRQATRDRSLRGKDGAHAPISPPLRAIFPLELFASRQFDLVQAILRPSRPQSALPSC
jgi:hypothetical protein